MSDRHYSDIDEDLYFEEPESDFKTMQKQVEKTADRIKEEENSDFNTFKPMYHSSYNLQPNEIQIQEPQPIQHEEYDDQSDSDYNPTNNKIVEEKMEYSEEHASDDSFDRRRMKKNKQKTVDVKIAEEEVKVRMRLEKLIKKRQEKIDIMERQVNIMADYQNIKYFVKLLYIHKVKATENFYFFANQPYLYAEIISAFNIKSLNSNSKGKGLEYKLDNIILQISKLSKSCITKRFSNLQMFIVLLSFYNISYAMDYYLTFKDIEIKSRFKLKSQKHKQTKVTRNSNKTNKSKKTVHNSEEVASMILDELYSNNIVLQIYDNNQIYKYTKFAENNSTDMINSLKGKFFFGVIRFQKNMEHRVSISHVSVLELEEQIWVQTLINICVIGLKNTIDNITNNNKDLDLKDYEQIIELKKQRIPQSNFEFRINEFYIVKSVLKRGELLREDAQPTGFYYKDEPVYYKNDVVELYGKVKWRMKGRKVKAGENPIKIMPNLYRENALMELYAEHQTEPYILEIKDGKLPENEFGNIELFGCPLPKELVHLDQKGIWRACKDLGIEYKQAVTGFDTRKGRNFAVKSGIVVFKKDVDKIMRRWKSMEKEIKEKEKLKQIDNAIKKWKMVFKSILIKRYMSNIIDH